MNLKQFASNLGVLSKTEIQKVRLLAYYFLRTDELAQFTTADVTSRSIPK